MNAMWCPRRRDNEAMPIERIPVTHKFGIISHSYKQVELLKKSARERKTAEKPTRRGTPE